MSYEAPTPLLAEIHTRRDLFAERLAEISIVACDEEGEVIEHPEIKGLSNGG